MKHSSKRLIGHHATLCEQVPSDSHPIMLANFLILFSMLLKPMRKRGASHLAVHARKAPPIGPITPARGRVVLRKALVNPVPDETSLQAAVLAEELRSVYGFRVSGGGGTGGGLNERLAA